MEKNWSKGRTIVDISIIFIRKNNSLKYPSKVKKITKALEVGIQYSHLCLLIHAFKDENYRAHSHISFHLPLLPLPDHFFFLCVYLELRNNHILFHNFQRCFILIPHLHKSFFFFGCAGSSLWHLDSLLWPTVLYIMSSWCLSSLLWLLSLFTICWILFSSSLFFP